MKTIAAVFTLGVLALTSCTTTSPTDPTAGMRTNVVTNTVFVTPPAIAADYIGTWARNIPGEMDTNQVAGTQTVILSLTSMIVSNHYASNGLMRSVSVTTNAYASNVNGYVIYRDPAYFSMNSNRVVDTWSPYSSSPGSNSTVVQFLAPAGTNMTMRVYSITGTVASVVSSILGGTALTYHDFTYLKH